jgi:O-antigen/teichoic acid export membrane protein
MQTSKNIFYNVLLAISQVVFPLITFPYLARTLGPSNIGVINFAESFAKYFILLAALGIPIYGVREIAKYAKDKSILSKTFSEIFLINLLGTFLLSIIFLGLIYFVPQLQMEKELFYWALGYFVLQIFQLEWFFTGMNQFKFIAIRSFIIRFLFIAAVFIFIHRKDDYVNYFILQLGLTVVLALLNGKKLFELLELRAISIKTLEFKKHLKPMALLFLTIFTISVYFSLDTILLGFLADNQSVGYYASALKLNRLFIAVLSAVSVAMFPNLVSLYHQGLKDVFIEKIEQSTFLAMSISIPLVLGITLCAPELIELLLGAHFERTILPLQITAPLIFIISLSGIFGFQVLSAVGKDRAIFIAALIGMLISIIAAIAWVPDYKEVGAAYTILLTEFAVSLAFFLFAMKHLQVKNILSIFFKQVLGALPYILIILAFKALVPTVLLRLAVITIFALAWFVLFQLYILPNSVYKKQLDLLQAKLFKSK